MKIRYYIKSFKDSDKISNFERGGYLFIEHHKINKILKKSIFVGDNKECLYDFEFKKISKASGLFKKSKITHEIKITDKQEYISEIVYLKPNIIQKINLHFNNRKTTDYLKMQFSKYFEKAVYALIVMVIGLLGFYIKAQINNAEKAESVKTSQKRDTTDFMKNSYLISNDTLTVEKTEIKTD